MTELDTALVALREDMTDSDKQSKYYDLFLNATLLMPTADAPSAGDGSSYASPLIIEADGCDYLMLFDSRERLFSWAGAEVPCVEVPGHLLAASTGDGFHWALNVGTPYSKRFLPHEIAWLREAVQNCEAKALHEEILGIKS